MHLKKIFNVSTNHTTGQHSRKHEVIAYTIAILLAISISVLVFYKIPSASENDFAYMEKISQEICTQIQLGKDVRAPSDISYDVKNNTHVRVSIITDFTIGRIDTIINPDGSIQMTRNEELGKRIVISTGLLIVLSLFFCLVVKDRFNLEDSKNQFFM